MRTLSHESHRFSALNIFAGLVIFSILGSGMERITHVSSSFVGPLAAAATLLTGLAALLTPAQGSYASAWRVLALGAGVELIGLASGWPFGHYQYTDRWWPVVSTPDGLHFPLLVPFAWVLVAGAAHLTVGDKLQPLARPIVAGLLAALCDLIMEPVMTGPLGYWKWTQSGPLPGGAPMLNFVGWWVSAALASWLLQSGGWEKPGNGWRVLGLYMILVVALGLIVKG